MHPQHMGRALRLHQPGSAFHVVARTQGKEPWFVDNLKDAIADILLAGTASVGAKPIAFAVMDNHFHILLLQGGASLGETLQPVMRRIAILIQKTQHRSGHIFERRYRAKLCADAEHLPNAILYVHRNPVKAGMCRDANEYRWSSARAYENKKLPGFLSIDDGLRAFDSLGGSSSVAQLREVYLARLHAAKDADLDDYWTWFMQHSRRRRRHSVQYVPRSSHYRRAVLSDVRDAALHILRSIDKDVDVDIVRSRYGGPRIVAIRRQLIAALLQRGYAGVDIARYLRVSQALVSSVKSAMRWGTVTGMLEGAKIE